jgi:hypothetical protein
MNRASNKWEAERRARKEKFSADANVKEEEENGWKRFKKEEAEEENTMKM